MKLFVENALIHRILEERFGGIANFADELAAAEGFHGANKKSQRGVSTIYAWLKNGLPSKSDTVFRFFGALGVDPIAVVDLERSRLSQNFGRLRAAFMLGGATAGGFGPLFELYRPSASWPDNSLLHRYFNCRWSVFDFVHKAENVTNTYATITVRGGTGEPSDWPRAFHIAYRRQSNSDGLWRPYGSIVSRSGEAILVHENGNIQMANLASQPQHQLRFKTYFGPSPVEFRLTCVHPFAGCVEPFDDPAVGLRFDG